jgi:Ca2+-binding EF-hand superfamily protein
VLKAQLSVDWRQLEDELPALWDQWDRDGDGTIDQQEMIAMAQYIRERMPRGPEAPVPSIENDKEAWFAHFDEDQSGTLEKGEVVRALIKTFRYHHSDWYINV